MMVRTETTRNRLQRYLEAVPAPHELARALVAGRIGYLALLEGRLYVPSDIAFIQSRIPVLTRRELPAILTENRLYGALEAFMRHSRIDDREADLLAQILTRHMREAAA